MFLSIFVFIFILGILVFAHELGHFLAAKQRGVRVEEFAFGFPPRLFGIRRGETLYSLNLIPVGGFVRLAGEAPDGVTVKENESEANATARRSAKTYEVLAGEPRATREGKRGADDRRYDKSVADLSGEPRLKGVGEENADDPGSFRSRPLGERIFIVMAGVAGNVILAWLLFSLAHTIGTPSVLDDGESGVGEVRVVITSVQPGSPAEAVGIRPGDAISRLNASDQNLQPVTAAGEVQDFIAAHRGTEITLTVERGGKKEELHVTPRTNAPEGHGALGIAMVRTGTRSYPWHTALIQGAITTWQSGLMIIGGTARLLAALVTEGRLIADVAGPVGIAALSHEATLLGLSYVIFFTAILSLNLAVINSLPLPALDGGRLLFLAIEWLKGSPVSRRAEQIAHTAGFAFLIALLALVTYRDVARIYN